MPTPTPTPAPARSRARTPASAPRPRTAGNTPAQATPPVAPEDRARWIEVAAYYIAERRGFANGSPDDDWLEAERELDRLIGLCKPAD